MRVSARTCAPSNAFHGDEDMIAVRSEAPAQRRAEPSFHADLTIEMTNQPNEAPLPTALRSAPLAPLQPSPPRKDTCEGAFWRGFGGWSMPHILESPGGSQAAKPRLDVSGATITAGSSTEIGAMTVRHYCSVVAQQLLIYKGIVSSEMVRRQILSAYEPRILGKGAGHDQDPLRNPRRNP
jgi:hypothetical protein